MKFIRPQQFDVVTEDIIKTLVKIGFYSLPLSIWKASEIVIEVIQWVSKL